MKYGFISNLKKIDRSFFRATTDISATNAYSIDSINNAQVQRQRPYIRDAALSRVRDDGRDYAFY